MADTVEAIEQGIVCEGCGEYIGEPVGHPRECRDCRMAGGEVVQDEDDDLLVEEEDESDEEDEE